MAKGEPHPLTGHLPPDRPHWGGEPLPTGHTPPGATLWPKGPPHLRPHRGGGPSPTGHLRPPSPHWPEKGTATHREKGSHALTGLPLATYWPPTGPLLAIRGGLPLAKGTEGGAYGHTGAPAPHFPATYGQRGHTTHWPPTGHLSPTWPSEAFGHLLPLPHTSR